MLQKGKSCKNSIVLTRQGCPAYKKELIMNSLSSMKKIEEMVKSSQNMGETIKVIAKEYNM